MLLYQCFSFCISIHCHEPNVLIIFEMAGALLFDEKIHQSAARFWFGLRDVGILYLQAIIQRTFDISPAFYEHGSEEKIVVGPHANRDPNKQNVRFIFA